MAFLHGACVCQVRLASREEQGSAGPSCGRLWKAPEVTLGWTRVPGQAPWVPVIVDPLLGGLCSRALFTWLISMASHLLVDALQSPLPYSGPTEWRPVTHIASSRMSGARGLRRPGEVQACGLGRRGPGSAGYAPTQGGTQPPPAV